MQGTGVSAGPPRDETAPQSMRLPYPRSFLGLLILGFALVVTPLVAGLATSALYTDRLAVRAQTVLSQATLTTQSTRRIATLLRDLERSARQAAILGEKTVPELYAALRTQLLSAADRLATAPFDSAQRARIARILAIEATVHAALADPDGSAETIERASTQFAEAQSVAEETITEADRLIDREGRAMSDMVEQARRVMFWQLAAVVPLAIVVVSGVALALARPVRKLDRAVRAIGAGRLADPVAVSGPQDIQRLGQRLEWLRTELLGIEQQKNRFMRHIAHELKTPLAAVRESSDLLAVRFGDTLSPTQRELADILRRNALELQRLVEDLLQLGEAQFRRLRLENELVDLSVVVGQVLAAHDLAARGKQLAFALELAEDARHFIADRDKLRVILDNLISNAIKHSPTGGKNEVMARRDVDGVVLGVHDEGPGIAREDREKVFDPFYLGRTTGTGVLKGSGVGLSIVREYAAAHGGEAQVTDDARGGAQLCVRLPVAAKTAERS